MMANMGWRPGEPVGLRGEGITEPIEPVLYSTKGEGLGFSPPKKTKTKTKKDPYRAIVHGSTVTYGKLQKDLGACSFAACTLSPKGRPIQRDETWAVMPEELHPVIWWGNGIMGVAEATFPHPKEWRLGDIDKPLDKITVSDLSRAFARKVSAVPSCKKAWETILGPVDWHAVANRLAVGLITPKDFGSYYANIIHRAFLTNPHNPSASSSLCRCCGGARETIEHLGECTGLRPVFTLMRRFDGGQNWDDRRLNLLGIKNKGMAVPSGINLLHLVCWKSILISMTHCSLKKTPFDPDVVLHHVQQRMQKRMKTALHLALIERNRAQARELPVRTETLRKWLKGLAEINKEGEVTFLSAVNDWLFRRGD